MKQNESHKPMPEWDKSAPAKSLHSLAVWFNDQAKGMFLQSGTHAELYFLYNRAGEGSLIQPPSNMDRETFQANLKATIRQNNIYGAIQIVEAWAYLPKQPGDHTFRQIAEGEIKVSELTPEDKSEVLMVRYQSSEGDQGIWISPILRTASVVSLGEAIEIKEGAKMVGRFGRLF